MPTRLSMAQRHTSRTREGLSLPRRTNPKSRTTQGGPDLFQKDHPMPGLPPAAEQVVPGLPPAAEQVVPGLPPAAEQVGVSPGVFCRCGRGLRAEMSSFLRHGRLQGSAARPHGSYSAAFAHWEGFRGVTTPISYVPWSNLGQPAQMD